MAAKGNVSAKTAIVLDSRRAKADNTYPVKLRITFERKQKYYPTNKNLTNTEFDRLMTGKRLSDQEKETKYSVEAFEKKAIDIIDGLPFFTWAIFEKQYSTNRAAKGTIEAAFTDYIDSLKDEGRIGTAVSYECAKTSLLKFSPSLKFADINPDFLRKYEKWMLAGEKSITTVGIYLRSLRTLFNNAINDGELTKEFYPFGRKRYEIPTGNNIKKALTLKEIAAIYRYKAEAGSTAERVKDYWIFMYLCNGINTKDFCLLKYENIKGDVLEFVRAKTARTKRNVEPIRATITPDMEAFVKKWGNKKKDANTYIFPILEKGLSPVRERQLIQQMTQVINCHMKAIAETLGITNDVTTYAARHSFATILQRSGAGTAFISEALGHSSTKTTQNYLAGFEDETKRNMTKALTAFDID